MVLGEGRKVKTSLYIRGVYGEYEVEIYLLTYSMVQSPS